VSNRHPEPAERRPRNAGRIELAWKFVAARVLDDLKRGIASFEAPSYGATVGADR